MSMRKVENDYINLSLHYVIITFTRTTLFSTTYLHEISVHAKYFCQTGHAQGWYFHWKQKEHELQIMDWWIVGLSRLHWLKLLIYAYTCSKSSHFTWSCWLYGCRPNMTCGTNQCKCQILSDGYHINMYTLIESKIYTVFAVISDPALISAPPHISQLIELDMLNMTVFKSTFYHVSLLRYWHFKFLEVWKTH